MDDYVDLYDEVMELWERDLERLERLKQWEKEMEDELQ
jgi:hypothetical protein